MMNSKLAEQAHDAGSTRALRQALVGCNQRTVEHLGECDVGGVVIRKPTKRRQAQRSIGADQRGRYNLQRDRKQIGQSVHGLFDWWSRASEEEDIADLVIKKRGNDDLCSPFHMIDEQRLSR